MHYEQSLRPGPLCLLKTWKLSIMHSAHKERISVCSCLIKHCLFETSASIKCCCQTPHPFTQNITPQSQFHHTHYLCIVESSFRLLVVAFTALIRPVSKYVSECLITSVPKCNRDPYPNQEMTIVLLSGHTGVQIQKCH